MYKFNCLFLGVKSTHYYNTMQEKKRISHSKKQNKKKSEKN